MEINEVKIEKRKFNKGRILKRQWIFDGSERNTKNVFITPENRENVLRL